VCNFTDHLLSPIFYWNNVIVCCVKWQSIEKLLNRFKNYCLLYFGLYFLYLVPPFHLCKNFKLYLLSFQNKVKLHMYNKKLLSSGPAEYCLVKLNKILLWRVHLLNRIWNIIIMIKWNNYNYRDKRYCIIMPCK
jgi:hypothetical protein